MGLMEPGCKLEDFGRPAQPAVSNRLRCRAKKAVSERYSTVKLDYVQVANGLCTVPKNNWASIAFAKMNVQSRHLTLFQPWD
jgi:hypothetical protein